MEGKERYMHSSKKMNRRIVIFSRGAGLLYCATISLILFFVGLHSAQAGTIAELERLSREQELLARCNALLRSGGRSELCLNKQSPDIVAEQLSKSVEIAKKCQELMNAGGTSPECNKVKRITPISNPNKSASEPNNSPSKLSTANIPSSVPEVLSYTRLGSNATIDALLGTQTKRLRLGQEIGGWRLVGLTDNIATFRKGGQIESIEFRQSASTPSLRPDPQNNYGASPKSYDTQQMPAPPLKARSGY